MANKEELITEDEAELYDRQIRLWGLEAQKRLIVFVYLDVENKPNINVRPSQ